MNDANVYGPLRAGQMLERTGALLRENFRLFFGIVLVVIAVEIVVGAVTGASGLLLGHGVTGRAAIARLLFLAPLYAVGLFLVFVFTQVVQGALFLAARARMANAAITVGEAWKLAGGKTGRLIGISVLVFLRSLGYMILFYVVLAIPFAAVLLIPGVVHAGGAGAFRLGHGAGIAAVGLLGIFGLAFLVLYVCALLWLVTRYASSVPAALAEDLGVTDAIRRSVRLSKGSKGRLVALYVCIGIIYLAILAFTVPIQLMILHPFAVHVTQSAAHLSAGMILLELFEYVVGAIVLAIVGVGVTVCYYDLRARKEGFGGESVAPVLELPTAPPAAGDWPIEDLPIS